MRSLEELLALMQQGGSLELTPDELELLEAVGDESKRAESERNESGNRADAGDYSSASRQNRFCHGSSFNGCPSQRSSDWVSDSQNAAK